MSVETKEGGRERKERNSFPAAMHRADKERKTHLQPHSSCFVYLVVVFTQPSLKCSVTGTRFANYKKFVYSSIAVFLSPGKQRTFETSGSCGDAIMEVITKGKRRRSGRGENSKKKERKRTKEEPRRKWRAMRRRRFSTERLSSCCISCPRQEGHFAASPEARVLT